MVHKQGMKTRQRKTGEQKFFNVKDAAARLEIKEQRLVALIEEGELLAVDVSGSLHRHLWRIPVTAIESYQTKRKSNGRKPK